jgi:hypothetical protein
MTPINVTANDRILRTRAFPLILPSPSIFYPIVYLSEKLAYAEIRKILQPR